MTPALTRRVRRFLHRRQIQQALARYRERTRKDAGKRQVHSDSGSFSSQVDRLFTIGNLAETGELERLATAAVGACITNRYYRPADFLSDICDALESHTALGTDATGEPPLDELDATARLAKLSTVAAAWMVPLKVASIESVAARFVSAVGKRIPYRAIGGFERQTARLFAYLGEAEIPYVERRLHQWIDRWAAAPSLDAGEPARLLADCVRCLTGELTPPGATALRPKARHLPVRLSTIEQTDRHELLRATLDAQLGTQPNL